MLKVMSHRRRLLRKNMYKSPHERNRNSLGNKRHFKKFNKPHNVPNIRFKKKNPKIDNKGYKMSYRFKYSAQDSIIVDEDVSIEESEN